MQNRSFSEGADARSRPRLGAGFGRWPNASRATSRPAGAAEDPGLVEVVAEVSGRHSRPKFLDRNPWPNVVGTDPVAADTFVYPDGIAWLRLERDGAGKVAAMRYFADGEGESERSARSEEPLPAR